MSQDTYFSTVEIFAPANQKWEPERAQQLMTSLFSLHGLIKLVIRANHDMIQWFVEIPDKHQNATIQALYTSYPKARVNLQPGIRPRIGYYTYHYHAGGPYIGPILYADSFKLDPLATLLGGMINLIPDEVVVYELELQSILPKHFILGKKIDITSYTGTMQRLMNEKLYGPLKQVTLAAKIRTSARTRANELVRLLSPGLTLFERPTSNYLVPAQPESYPLILSPYEVAALWHLPSEQCLVPGITWATAVSTPVPRSVTNKAQGICLGSNRFRGQLQDVWLPYRDRVTHVNIIGKTGTGKSTLLHNMIHQDIAAGKGVAVIDPHGDLVDQILRTSIPADREQDVVLLDITDTDYPVGLNFFSTPENIDNATAADSTLAVVRKMFAESWSSTRMEDTLYSALVALQSIEGSTIRDVTRLLNDSEYRAQVLKQVQDPVVLEFWYEDFELLTANHQREIARPIVNRIRKFYRNKNIGRIVGQSECLEFNAIMDRELIFLAKIPTGGIEAEAETLGALLISKFQLAAMSRTAMSQADRKPYYLYIDEVQNLAASGVDVLFSEARKTGLNLVVANQFLGQLSGSTLESVMGNVGTSIMFALGPKDATTLTPYVRPQLTSDDLVNLDRFSTVVRMQQGGKTQPAFNMHTVGPVKLPEDASNRTARIYQLSREKYARHREVVDAEMLKRYEKYQQRTNKPKEEDGYFG